MTTAEILNHVDDCNRQIRLHPERYQMAIDDSRARLRGEIVTRAEFDAATVDQKGLMMKLGVGLVDLPRPCK